MKGMIYKMVLRPAVMYGLEMDKKKSGRSGGGRSEYVKIVIRSKRTRILERRLRLSGFETKLKRKG